MLMWDTVTSRATDSFSLLISEEGSQRAEYQSFNIEVYFFIFSPHLISDYCSKDVTFRCGGDALGNLQMKKNQSTFYLILV